MTVKDLIKELEQFDENMKVVVYTGDMYDTDEVNDVTDFDDEIMIRSL